VINKVNGPGEDTFDDWKTAWTEWADKLDQLGVTIVVAGGNGGMDVATGKPRYYTDDMLPAEAVDRDSPVIAVGGVYKDGSLWEGSSPPRKDSKSELSIYALAAEIEAYVSADGQVKTQKNLKGTSGASAQVVSLKSQPSCIRRLCVMSDTY